MRTTVLAINSRPRLVAGLAAMALAAAVILSLTATRSPAGTPSSSQELAALKAQLAGAQRDARFWQQLTSAFTPAKTLGMKSMADHLVLRTPGGPVLALHFDSINLAKAKNLNWVAYALPGQFSRSSQARLNRLYGPGFTHFHDLKTDVHGGKVGTPGVWFVHIGTRDFRSPFGRVRVGHVDRNFMQTRPPAR